MPSSKPFPSWLAFGLVSLYSLAQLWWYLGTPLGQSPVLDGQENLLLAQKIASGELEHAPFFRAMLYPALLAFLPLGHSLLGLLGHLLNTVLSHRLARRFWNSEQAGLLAAALVGFNPVLLHFAFDPLDATLSITFLLAALAALQKTLAIPARDPRGTRLAAMGGLLLALAALTRPHLLLALLAVASLLLYGLLSKRLPFARLAAFAFATALPFLALGFLQQSQSGSFRVVPTQDAYSLWVSNHPDANGLYYQQSLRFHSLAPHENPGQIEGRILYEQANGSPGSADERNAYWRTRTLKSVLENPLQWLQLEVFKLYAALNNFEQYNNKTYSFHKTLSPILRHNPISWGLLLALASFCSITLWRQLKARLIPLLFVAASILAGLLIFMASARFRLPLVPLLAIVAAGLPVVWPVFKASSWNTRRRALAGGALAGGIAFSQLAGVASTKTYLQDTLLLADAAARIGDDAMAIHWAGETLHSEPAQQQALRILLISQYNQVANGTVPASPELWQELSESSRAITLEDELLSFVQGIVLWNNASPAQAIEHWESGYNSFGLSASSCLAALELASWPVKQIAFPAPLPQFFANGQHRLYAYAIAKSLPAQERASFLDAIGLSLTAYESIGASLERVLPQPQGQQKAGSHVGEPAS